MIVAPSRFGTRAGKRRVPPCIIRASFARAIRTTPMEAERVNAIANRLADLARREAELRRYL
jgi:hypothetical protein